MPEPAPTKPAIPGQVVAGLAILAASLLPMWFIDLGGAPIESGIRIATTVFVLIALWAVSRRISVMRWVLLVLLGMGVIVSVWSFISAGTIEIESALISAAQVIGLALLFTPVANRWFALSWTPAEPPAA